MVRGGQGGVGSGGEGGEVGDGSGFLGVSWWKRGRRRWCGGVVVVGNGGGDGGENGGGIGGGVGGDGGEGGRPRREARLLGLLPFAGNKEGEEIMKEREKKKGGCIYKGNCLDYNMAIAKIPLK